MAVRLVVDPWSDWHLIVARPSPRTPAARAMPQIALLYAWGSRLDGIKGRGDGFLHLRNIWRGCESRVGSRRLTIHIAVAAGQPRAQRSPAGDTRKAIEERQLGTLAAGCGHAQHPSRGLQAY